jgi:hypothetical protein
MRNRLETWRKVSGVRAGCAAGLLAVFAGGARAEPIAISDAWVRATPPGASTAAAYLVIATTGAADRLVGASSDASREVQLHAHVMRGGVAQMTEIDALPVVPDAPATLAPGGNHLMLIGIARPLAAGDRVRIALQFERGGIVEVEIPVRDARGSSPVPGVHGAP